MLSESQKDGISLCVVVRLATQYCYTMETRPNSCSTNTTSTHLIVSALAMGHQTLREMFQLWSKCEYMYIHVLTRLGAYLLPLTFPKF